MRINHAHNFGCENMNDIKVMQLYQNRLQLITERIRVVKIDCIIKWNKTVK